MLKPLTQLFFLFTKLSIDERVWETPPKISEVLEHTLDWIYYFFFCPEAFLLGERAAS